MNTFFASIFSLNCKFHYEQRVFFQKFRKIKCINISSNALREISKIQKRLITSGILVKDNKHDPKFIEHPEWTLIHETRLVFFYSLAHIIFIGLNGKIKEEQCGHLAWEPDTISTCRSIHFGIYATINKHIIVLWPTFSQTSKSLWIRIHRTCVKIIWNQ